MIGNCTPKLHFDRKCDDEMLKNIRKLLRKQGTIVEMQICACDKVCCSSVFTSFAKYALQLPPPLYRQSWPESWGIMLQKSNTMCCKLPLGSTWICAFEGLVDTTGIGWHWFLPVQNGTNKFHNLLAWTSKSRSRACCGAMCIFQENVETRWSIKWEEWRTLDHRIIDMQAFDPLAWNEFKCPEHNKRAHLFNHI